MNAIFLLNGMSLGFAIGFVLRGMLEARRQEKRDLARAMKGKVDPNLKPFPPCDNVHEDGSCAGHEGRR